MRIIILLSLLPLIGIGQEYKMTDMIPKADSVVQSFIEESIIDRINEYRKKKGVTELRVDTLLKPAAVHHVLYMRHTNDLTHDETEDVPNFTEYYAPSTRWKYLLDTQKFWGIQEELLSNLVLFNSPNYTFKDVVETAVTNGFKTSYAHWRSLMSDEYDCIYVIYDFNLDEDNGYGTGITCIVLLGVSSDDYKKELGILE